MQMGNFVWCQTDNQEESWQLFKNAVRPMWWLRALGCAKMMVNERLVPSGFEILDALQTRARKKYQEELPTLKMLILQIEGAHSPSTCSHRNIEEIKFEQAYG